MFVLAQIKKRYFEALLQIRETDEDGEIINEKEVKLLIEPCKIKLMRKIIKLDKNSPDDEIFDIFKKIINKNTSDFKLSDEQLGEYDINEMLMILTSYFEWLNGEKDENPN